MNAELARIKEIFLSLSDVMEAERDRAWLSKVKDINEIIEAYDAGTLSEEEVLDLLRTKYKAMHPPHGGFDEYFIWRNDSSERARVNKEFVALANEAWKILVR